MNTATLTIKPESLSEKSTNELLDLLEAFSYKIGAESTKGKPTQKVLVIKEEVRKILNTRIGS